MICAYLDSLHDGKKLIPADGKARWQVLHLEGLADGLCESAIAVVRENVRPDEDADGKIPHDGRKFERF